MKVFEFENYKEFLKKRISEMPRGGRGQLSQIASVLGVQPSMISQILRGEKHLSLEQAHKLTQHLGLSDLETQFFLNLIQRERAGTEALKQFFRRENMKIFTQAQDVKNRVRPDQELSQDAQMLFYSQWYYSAVRLLTEIEGYQTIDSIADYFGFSKKLVASVLEFLTKSGLCVEKEGRYVIGPKKTHLSATAFLIGRHHSNWRQKAIEKSPRLQSTELMFSAPISLSHKDFQKVKDKLLNVIEEVSHVVETTRAERLACLNLDWFEVR